MKKLLIQKNENKIFFVKVFDGDIVSTSVIDLSNTSIVGNVYVGKVDKVIKNSFAFVNIGQSKNAFININDKKEMKLSNVKEGDDVLVQVNRDQTDIKGASLSTEIVIKGKYLMVVLSEEKQVGVSKKITNTNIKKRLRKLGNSFEYSVVFRTEAQDVTKEELVLEYENLKQKLDELVLRGKHQLAPKLVYEQDSNSSLVAKTIELSNDCEKIYVNKQDAFTELNVEELKDKITFDESVDLHSSHYVKKQIDELFHQKVWLKSGAFLVIEYTEAFVIVDVNSGKNIKEKDKELLAVKTNKESIKKIVEQIVLRNLSGIILVDLIDMKELENKEEIVKFATDLVKKDTDFSIHGLTNLGILEVTRKKRSEPLYKIL